MYKLLCKCEGYDFIFINFQEAKIFILKDFFGEHCTLHRIMERFNTLAGGKYF